MNDARTGVPAIVSAPGGKVRVGVPAIVSAPGGKVRVAVPAIVSAPGGKVRVGVATIISALGGNLRVTVLVINPGRPGMVGSVPKRLPITVMGALTHGRLPEKAFPFDAMRHRAMTCDVRSFGNRPYRRMYREATQSVAPAPRRDTPCVSHAMTIETRSATPCVAAEPINATPSPEG